ncbi:hypothetical protein DICSQDRAFT_138879 [Dichomitus squalens LYAD-421 SS1]|uniref:Uncharacterized protein n=1 Tax=Dichomitus squalens (strain LYAD-421) TaxID=732165 RepID=R7SSP9_DICSQ|nr:uncharacterized protein DICSQDRAFT_138879 [Dichomitus squalens LYAD-421 SS1]EJF58983.1 hypothetical protein DICSQDRAFT_138879 [Dichomitus squalens LYAD-421 SS1]
MLRRLAPALVLLSVLKSPHVLAAPAVVSLLVPFALPDEAISASFLGDDGQGHSSYALGVGAASGAFTNTATINGVLIAGPTDVQLVGVDLTTVIDGATAVVTGSADCAFPTGAVAGSSVQASCNLAGQGVVNAPGGVQSENNVQDSFPQTIMPIIGLQLPDSGPGALPGGGPSASATASPSQNTGGAAPSATGGAASPSGSPAKSTSGGGSAAPSGSGSSGASSPSPTHNGAMEGGLVKGSGWGVVVAAGLVLVSLL